MVETNKRDIDVKLLELLACPLTKGPLKWDAERGELVSRLAKLAYPVRDGIPVMLPSEARQIGDQEANPGA
ncbi:Trm112 family protein [Aminobacter sp. BA135]|uniref:Trm112 family protein n=1 Tax=Aminobacter sp. BA135 TaxID=537596 RepID=UPI003D792C25